MGMTGQQPKYISKTLTGHNFGQAAIKVWAVILMSQIVISTSGQCCSWLLFRRPTANQVSDHYFWQYFFPIPPGFLSFVVFFSYLFS